MAYIRADRIKETSTTVGTITYVLAGAAVAHRTFGSVMANNDICTYCAENGTDWEVGVGTWTTGGNLSRDNILASSNAGAKVVWAAGSKNIFLTPAAGEAIRSQNLPLFPVISNMKLRASSQFSGITKGTDGLVTAVTNLGSLGGNFVNGSTAGKPRYLPRRFNGFLPCLWMDGTNNDHLKYTLAGAILSPATIVMVVEDIAIGTGDGNFYRDQSGNGVGYLQGGNSWSIFMGSGFQSLAHWTANKDRLPGGMVGLPCVRADVYNAAASLIRNNGTDVTGTVGANGSTLFAAVDLHIGNGATAVTSAAKFLLYEFLLFDKALSGAELTQLDTYYKLVAELAF